MPSARTSLSSILARASRLAGLAVAFGSIAARSAPASAEPPRVVAVDRDDDDADGVADADDALVPSAPELVRLELPRAGSRGELSAIRGDAGLRVLADGRALAPGDPIPAAARRLEIQATAPGTGAVDVLGRTIELHAISVLALDGRGSVVDLARSHASLQRTPPDRLADDPLATSVDPDALRFIVAGAADDLPPTLSIVSVSPAGEAIDGLSDVPLREVPCPAAVRRGLLCGSTLPIRAVSDDIDRSHPMVSSRSIKAELGGALVVAAPHGAKLQMIRVGGPRSSAVGAIERFRARLRVFMVRVAPRGPPPMGGDEAGAIEVARGEVRRANALWGSCGVSFGPPSSLEVSVVDPPRPHLLALGCDAGLPSSGGTIHVRVEGRDVSTKIAPGMTPRAAARVVAAAIEGAGFAVRVSDNPAIGAGAAGSSDVLVRRKDGALAAIEAPGTGPVSSDATLTACIGQVELEDGLHHFGDVDAIAGTVEERTLIKAFDDGDPATIEVFMVPAFAGGGRIGESFIAADVGAIRNAVIEDRAGVRAERSSFALAHELGHVLLDDPGHPDDFGVDTPTRLMDADAANASAYGPRRLTLEECARAIRQSAHAGVLTAWPLTPIGRAK